MEPGENNPYFTSKTIDGLTLLLERLVMSREVSIGGESEAVIRLDNFIEEKIELLFFYKFKPLELISTSVTPEQLINFFTKILEKPWPNFHQEFVAETPLGFLDPERKKKIEKLSPDRRRALRLFIRCLALKDYVSARRRLRSLSLDDVLAAPVAFWRRR